MYRILDLIISYRYSFIKVLLFEIFYIILGYKGNKFINRNKQLTTDTIPCPYLFLYKIVNDINKLNIESITDIGCGNGRAINFFNKKLDLKLYGYEIFSDSFDFCKNSFKNDKNITIHNTNFFLGDHLKGKVDCYFINDPIKDLYAHNKLFGELLNFLKSKNRNVFFILVNMSPEKLDIFKNLTLISFYRAGVKGYRIYRYNNQ